MVSYGGLTTVTKYHLVRKDEHVVDSGGWVLRRAELRPRPGCRLCVMPGRLPAQICDPDHTSACSASLL